MLEKDKGVKFDATINLGHIITFIGFLMTGFITWSTLDTRVVILEQATKVQELRDRQQDNLLTSTNQHIAESLTEIKRAVEKISDRIEKRN